MQLHTVAAPSRFSVRTSSASYKYSEGEPRGRAPYAYVSG